MSTDPSPGRITRLGSAALSRLPSWRSWIALLVGLAVGIGAFILSSEQTRVGVRSAQVTINDAGGYFDEEELRDAIDEVSWGRSMRILVAVIPVSELPPSDDCAQDSISCLRSIYPGYFPTVRVEDSAVVLWLDPERQIVNVGMGVRHEHRSDTFFQSEYDLARVLTYRAASGELKPESITDAFQWLSDEEADASSGRSWTDYLLALTAGGIAALLVGLILNAARQSAAQRKQALGLAKLPASERRSLVDRVYDTYRDATANLEEIELVRASRLGRYQHTMDVRVSQYQRRYVQLARAVFEVQHLDRDALIKPARLPRLVTLDRLATIVREAQLTLDADAKAADSSRGRGNGRLSNRALADHPSMKHLHTALEAATELAETTGNELLIKQLPTLAEDLAKAGAASPVAALANLDDLARRFATVADPVFVDYAAEHGTEFARRADIEDPFRYRVLELTGTGNGGTRTGTAPRGNLRSKGRAKKKEVTAAQVKRNLEERLAAAKVEQDSSTLKVPVSPIVIMVAAAVAIAAGGVYLWLNPVGEGTVIDAEQAVVTIPETIVTSPEQQSAAITVPDGPDYPGLVEPESVEVIDEAGIFEDPQALEDALSLIPMPGSAHYVVLTSENRLAEEADGIYDKQGLLEAFPQHFESITEDYIRVIEDDTFIIWYTDSGGQVGFERASTDMDPDYYGWSRAQNVIRNTYPTYELQVWDALAGFSSGARGIGVDASDTTLESGSSNVSGAVIAALVAFGLLVFLLPRAIEPLVVRRRRRAWQRELTTTMTALTLAHEALSLDIAMVAIEHQNYDAETRFHRWNEDYLDVLRLVGNAEEFDLDLEDQLRLARTVREQAESLWRIRPILELQPTWSQAWENESSALYAALESASSSTINRISELAPQLASGTISPAKALQELDRIAEEQRGTARLRCVKTDSKPAPPGNLGAETFVTEPDTEASVSLLSTPLVTDAGRLARTPLFALEPKDDIDIGIAGASTVGGGETVQEITREREAAKAFFSIDTSATRWLHAAGKSILTSIEDLHDESPAQIRKTLVIYTGVGITAFITLQIISAFLGEGRDTMSVQVENSQMPLSVTYVNDGGEELSDDLLARFEEEELGAPVHLLIYSTPEECTYDTLEDKDHLASQAPLAISTLYDRTRPNTSGAVLCLGSESAYFSAGANVSISSSLRSAMSDYRFSSGDEVSHEEWLADWFDDPDRGSAFEINLRVVEQIDNVIR